MTDTGVIWRGAERELLRPLLERCEAMLTAVQWSGANWNEPDSGDWNEMVCPVCGGDSPARISAAELREGQHEATCELVALMADLRKELGK